VLSFIAVSFVVRPTPRRMRRGHAPSRLKAESPSHLELKFMSL